MSIELLSFVLGGFLVAVGLLGGGIEVRELKVPSVGRITRVLSFAAGLAFVGLAVFLGPGQVKESAAVNAEPAALLRVTFCAADVWRPETGCLLRMGRSLRGRAGDRLVPDEGIRARGRISD
jgi:hypothetical protein